MRHTARLIGWAALLCAGAARPSLLRAQASASDSLARDTTRADTISHANSERVTSRFYKHRPYGAESTFNPFSVVINGGFDELRVADAGRQIFRRDYSRSATAVWHSVTHADAVIRHFGVSRWLRDEVFPLSLKSGGGGQWYPNYHLHLFSGSLTYAELVEWYEAHNIAHPKLVSGFTMYTWHFLTEIVEDGGRCCEDEDGMTDLLIFDSSAIVLGNQSWWLNWFGGPTLQFSTWAGQPSLTVPEQRLENAYMLTMVRSRLPKSDNWRAITTMGAEFLVGISRRVGRDDWISPMFGADPADNPIIDPVSGAKTATLKPSFGLFYDRGGSLLASFVAKGAATNGPTLNVYPGVLGWGPFKPGVWVQAIRGGGVRFGIVAPALGVGVGKIEH